MPELAPSREGHTMPSHMFTQLAALAGFGQDVIRHIQHLTTALHDVQRQCTQLQGELHHVRERLKLELGRRFAAKQEAFVRQSTESGQIILGFFASSLLAHEPVQELAATTREAEAGSTSGNPPDKKKKSRESKPLDLSKLERRVVATSKLSDEERHCHTCGNERRCMNVIERERIGFKPAHFYVEVCEREVCVCDHCDTPPVTAPNPHVHLDESKVSPSLQAGILVAKLGFGIPWHRWSRMMEDASGMTLPETSLERLTQRSLDQLIPLAGWAKAKTLDTSLVSIDDSFGKILLPKKDRTASLDKTTQAGRMWFGLGDVSKFAFVEYTPNWKASHLSTILGETKAQIQGDGYPGYVSFCNLRRLKLPAGCMDHARRLFVQAHKLGHAQAAQVLELMGELYTVESQIKRDELTDLKLILDRRKRLSEPIFNQLAQLIHRLHESRMTRDVLSRATKHFIGQESRLRVYLSDARIPISNIHVERMIRVYAVMRAASKLIGSPQAAKRIAAGLTMVINAILSRVSLHDYFTWLFNDLPKCKSSDLSEYLPQAYARSLSAVSIS